MLSHLRQQYHQNLCEHILYLRPGGIPNFADKHSRPSVALAKSVVQQFGYPLRQNAPSGQAAGIAFEEITMAFLRDALALLQHLRPASWEFSVHSTIKIFEQYAHLADLETLLNKHKDLRAALGDYLIKPDIVIGRVPLTDREINQNGSVVDDTVAKLTPLRSENFSQPKPILHASISCKWTIRSDRSQNSRTEGLNLIRNRKGQTPHIAVVTAEPYPQRIASLALGTGDIDCVYHIALPELQIAAEEYNNQAVLDMLNTLVNGKRLRDISDLPLDLIV